MSSNKLQIDESLPSLLKGIGLTIVVIGTLVGVIHAKADSYNQARRPVANSKPKLQQTAAESGQEESLAALTREVARLRMELAQETTVEEVLVNPWFEGFSLLGSAVFATSFYLEWYIKRSRAREHGNLQTGEKTSESQLVG